MLQSASYNFKNAIAGETTIAKVKREEVNEAQAKVLARSRSSTRTSVRRQMRSAENVRSPKLRWRRRCLQLRLQRLCMCRQHSQRKLRAWSR